VALGTVLLIAVAAQAGAGASAECDDGRIARVVIDNVSIFEETDPDRDRRFNWAYTTANALHFRTRASVIQRELLFEPGDCFDAIRIDESARLLREMTFLADAEIRAERRGDGDWDVIVETRDDWSTTLDLRIRFDQGLAFEGARLYEQNVLGTGHEVSVFYFERDVTRDYGLSLYTPQLTGTRWDLAAAVGRSRAGTFVRQELAYPFVGEIGRWAGRQAYIREDYFFDYVLADDPDLEASHLLVPMRDKAFDVALVRRIGSHGHSSLVGAGISYRAMDYPSEALLAPGGDYANRETADVGLVQSIEDQGEALEVVRLAMLLGHRNIWWVQRRGLDSMRGLQDIRLGAEVGFELARSLPAFARDDDLAATLSLYTGLESGQHLVIGRARADARRDLDAPRGVAEWKDLYGDAELIAYLFPSEASTHTIVLRASGLGGWSTRTPFQLTLGGERGVRAYDFERFPGGHRVVFTLEDRLYLGFPFRDVLDTGTTLLLDAGRIWAGDAPFGQDSGWRAAAGLGLRGAFPAGSRATFRLDVIWPIERATQLGDFRLRFSFGEPFGLLRPLADHGFLRSRPGAVAGRLGEFR